MGDTASSSVDGHIPPVAPPTQTVEHLDRGPLDRAELAAMVARDLPAGSCVNLRIVQPTTVADYFAPDSFAMMRGGRLDGCVGGAWTWRSGSSRSSS